MGSDERAAKLRAANDYFGVLIPLLNLTHWQVSISDDPPDNETASAQVCWNASDWRATVSLSDYYLDSSPDLQRLHATHELVHLHLRGVCQSHQSLAGHFGTAMWIAIDDRFVHESELAVDGLAMVLAPLLPLPPE